MIIAINCRVLTERAGGPARYTRNMIRELASLDTKNTYHLIFNRAYAFDFPLPRNFRVFTIKSETRFIFDYLRLPLFAWSNRADVFLFPKNTFSPLIPGKKIPVYHDIVYFEKNLHFREFGFFDTLHHTVMIPVAARFAARNLAVSDFTASRMRELLGIDDHSISVIKEGVEGTFRQITDKKYLKAVEEKYSIRRPFFFYSGSLSPRKNMVRVLEAFAGITREVPHSFYFTAADSWRDEAVFRVIEEHGLHERVKRLGYLDDEELAAMYNLADAYLYPSLYEGFGLPILEAQACGCPVVTSSAASCPEVAGEGALIVDPYRVEEIAGSMLRLARDGNLRKRLVRKGLENCRRFSWRKAAAELIRLFEELGGGRT